MSSGRNIVLTGFMGTGKTSVSRELSRITGMRVIDMDAEIEKQEGMKISEIFSSFGEPRFREIETEIAKKTASKHDVIISAGGGAVLREENVKALSGTGDIVCLWAEPEEILKRTGRSDDRPLLQVEDPLKKIKELLDFRRPFYEKAGLRIDTDGLSPREVAEEILRRLGWKK